MKRLRQQSGMTQEELAELAGVHAQFISQIERGQRQPTLDTVDQIAMAMSTTAAKLLGVGEGPDKGRPSSSAKVRRLLASWSGQDQDRLAQVLIELRKVAASGRGRGSR